jgi:hypothetical protein
VRSGRTVPGGTRGQDVSTARTAADPARSADAGAVETVASARSERGTNRRLTARTACHLTVRYKSGSGWHPATAMDLSRHGCRLRLGEDLTRGALVALSFENTGSSVPAVEIQGRVIWSRLEGLSYQAGMHFADVTADLERLIAGSPR